MRHLILNSGSIVLLAILAFLGCTDQDRNSSAGPPANRAQVQILADTLTIRPVTAQGIRSAVTSTRGRAVLVNIWATWCVPCREEFPDILRVYREQKPRGLELMLVSADFDSDLPQARRFLASQGVGFVTYLKTGKDMDFIDALSPEWTGALPATFIFDASGRVRSFWEGKASYETFSRKVKEVLGELE